MGKRIPKEIEKQIAGLCGSLKYIEIAKRFNVTPATVSRIAERNSWKGADKHKIRPLQIWELETGYRLVALPYKDKFLFYDKEGDLFDRPKLHKMVNECLSFYEVAECLNAKRN